MSNVIEIKVPDIGDFSEVEVIELLVAPGDTIKEEQSLITVESDKASMEIPSSAAGVVKDINVKVGDKVAEGKVILTLEAAQDSGSDKEAPKAKARTRAEQVLRRMILPTNLRSARPVPIIPSSRQARTSQRSRKARSSKQVVARSR
ncbi:dihydrolipoamide acetyltransferase [Advenella kashmirensis WT001]|uniref:Dihydrolipoamide acetyltransferase n=1 Tax=Advenella kashmirensis (strain DSM 17095 / LMG 22695 / WT001) TaxID=1036672 RepID=I3UBW4_ADVKW|nr:dihydrolipoamide acetyltransferase [Advenella kashmirensis WT001]